MAKSRTSSSSRSADHRYPAGQALDRRMLLALRQVIRCADIDSRRLSAEHDVTGPQLLTLAAVVDTDGITAREIADRIHVSPSTVVGVLDRLEQSGLISRSRSSQDRRRVHISPTATGRKLAKRVAYPLLESIQESLQNVPEDRAEWIVSWLEGLAARVNADEEVSAMLNHTRQSGNDGDGDGRGGPSA